MKRILLVLFLAGVLKAGAQENRWEVSVGLGPSFTRNESPHAGLAANGKLGFKINNVLTVFAGADFISFPVKDQKFTFWDRVDTANTPVVRSMEVRDAKASMNSYLIGGRIDVPSKNLFSPYLTAALGIFSETRPRVDIESRSIMYEEEESLFFKMSATVGGGVNFNFATDKALFTEVTVQGRNMVAFTSVIIGTRISF
ncbi:MAG: hypothetical protein V4642_16170 [Bacteroidota bacterium]